MAVVVGRVVQLSSDLSAPFEPRDVYKEAADWMKMRDRIDELEEQVLQLKRVLRPGHRFWSKWRLTAAQAAMLALLSEREYATYDQLAVAGSVDTREDPSKTVKVHMCHMRQRLRPPGIEIKTLWGVGYCLDAENKAKVKAGIVSAGNNVAN